MRVLVTDFRSGLGNLKRISGKSAANNAGGLNEKVKKYRVFQNPFEIF
jgi:hypothetical protein